MVTLENESKRPGDTRERILKEAEKLYHEGGYDKISLQEVAEALGIKKAALFYHYKNKQELFYAMLKAMVERMHLVIVSTLTQAEPAARDRLRAVLQRMTLEPDFDTMHFLRNDYEMLSDEQRREMQQLWNNGLYMPLRQIFQEGVEKGELKAHSLDTATYMFLNLWTLLPRVDSPMNKYRRNRINASDYIDEMLDLFLNGIN
ncbi:MAG TPA: TetR/AcrR family transcriptional regulator [Chloroflexia bacterium]|nr:TetR/AcrR family transcriptional regulator [Chloroflexia bacterium]